MIRPKLGSASYVGSFAIANILVAYRHGLRVSELCCICDTPPLVYAPAAKRMRRAVRRTLAHPPGLIETTRLMAFDRPITLVN